jgi:ATP-binding cassette, subfamily B, bacterial
VSGSRNASLTQTLPGLRRVLRRFAPYLKEHSALLGGSVIALLAATAFKLLEPWPLKFIIDRVVPTERGAGSGIPAIDALEPMTLLTLAALALVAVVGLKAVFDYAARIGFALVGNGVLTAVRNDLFRHLQGLSLGFHARARTGDLTMRLIGDVGMLKETAVTAALPLAANVLVLVGMIAVMLALNWQLALIALLPMPLLWLSSVRIGRRIQEVSRKQRQREGEMAATAAETMAGIRAVQALSLEDRVAETFVGASRRDLREGVKAKRLAAGLERVVDVLVAIGLAAVLWFGTLQVLSGRLTPGDLLVFITYAKNMFRPVREYAKYTARLAKATAAGERIISLLDERPAVFDAPVAVPAPAFRGEVTFDNVAFGYGGDPCSTLADVCFVLHPGQCVAVTGPSGVGKSTLSSLLLRLYDPSAGRVLIDGQDIRDFTVKSLRASISLVPQETPIFHGSIAENIALGSGREVGAEEIEAAAKLANAHDFIMALPDGYTTTVAERGTTLSAGQRQRIAIARAALRESPILVLDEPTVGLDRANEHAVRDALWRLSTGRTTLLITHDLDLAAGADRILVIGGGTIAEDGSHAELMARGGQYANLQHARVSTPAHELRRVVGS